VRFSAEILNTELSLVRDLEVMQVRRVVALVLGTFPWLASVRIRWSHAASYYRFPLQNFGNAASSPLMTCTTSQRNTASSSP
jgi:hypothetical protein